MIAIHHAAHPDAHLPTNGCDAGEGRYEVEVRVNEVEVALPACVGGAGGRGGRCTLAQLEAALAEADGCDFDAVCAVRSP